MLAADPDVHAYKMKCAMGLQKSEESWGCMPELQKNTTAHRITWHTQAAMGAATIQAEAEAYICDQLRTQYDLMRQGIPAFSTKCSPVVYGGPGSAPWNR